MQTDEISILKISVYPESYMSSQITELPHPKFKIHVYYLILWLSIEFSDNIKQLQFIAVLNL